MYSNLCKSYSLFPNFTFPISRFSPNFFSYCSFVCLVVFPVNKTKSYVKNYNIKTILRYNNRIQSYNELWRKVLRSELSLSREGTFKNRKVLSPSLWSYNVVLEAVSQRCFKIYSPKKSQKKQEKKKSSSGV